MKKLGMFAIVGVFVAMQAGIALAVDDMNTGPGCGLGKLAFKSYPNLKTKGAQILMATLNVIGGQTFAISTGTSGCSDDGRWWAEQKATMFAELNADALAQDMAQGNGEHLASMATLLGVPQPQHEAFFAMAQGRYAMLSSAGDMSAAAMVKTLNEGIFADPLLAKVVLN